MLTFIRIYDATQQTTMNTLNNFTWYDLFSGASYEIQVYFRCSLVGFYPATLAFEFKPDLHSTAFHIVRFIEAQYITSLGLELAPIAPYKPRSLPAWTPEADFMIVDGQPPEGYHSAHC